MNKPHILFHLTEAREALQKLIEELQSDQDYEFGDYRVDMEHLITTSTLLGTAATHQKKQSTLALKKISAVGASFLRTSSYFREPTV